MGMNQPGFMLNVTLNNRGLIILILDLFFHATAPLPTQWSIGHPCRDIGTNTIIVAAKTIMKPT